MSETDRELCVAVISAKVISVCQTGKAAVIEVSKGAYQLSSSY